MCDCFDFGFVIWCGVFDYFVIVFENFWWYFVWVVGIKWWMGIVFDVELDEVSEVFIVNLCCEGECEIDIGCDVVVGKLIVIFDDVFVYGCCIKES